MELFYFLGKPTYLVANLLNMSDYGGTGAEALKSGIDHIFSKDGTVPCSNYTTKMVGATSDGASVNTGHKGGLMVKLQNDSRPWLIKIHCVNHKVELAVKEAFSNSEFAKIDKLYLGIFNLLKNSGALKTEVRSASEVLDISTYTLPKITGTRFVSHRVRALRNFLNMWPAIISAFENSLATRKHKPETRAKIEGFIKNLKSYEYLTLTCSYLDLLEKISPASLVFEGNDLMPSEIKPTINRTNLELEDIEETAGTPDEYLDSNISRFLFTTNEDGEKFLHGSFVKNGHMLKKPCNRENVQIPFIDFKYLSNETLQKASESKKKLAEELRKTLNSHFESFLDEIFSNAKWLEPKHWEENREYGLDQIKSLVDHFEIPLNEANFNHDSALAEWRRFRKFVKVNFGDKIGKDEITAQKIWEKTFNFHRNEFPNLCILAELVLVLSGSNSSVERAFSLLTLLLSNRRLKMKHDTINDLVIIKGNDPCWTDNEKRELLKRAEEIYMSTRRKLQVDGDDSDDYQPKKQKRETPIIDSGDYSEKDLAEFSDSDSESDIVDFSESSSSDEDTTFFL